VIFFNPYHEVEEIGGIRPCQEKTVPRNIQKPFRNPEGLLSRCDLSHY